MVFFLPYTIPVAADKTYSPFSRADGELTVVIHPLMQFKEMNGIAPPIFETTPRPSDRITYNGKPVYEMDSLAIDLICQDFDRSQSNSTDGQPAANQTIRQGYSYANEFLSALRNTTQNPGIRPIEGPAYLQFLNDDGSNLAQEEGKYRISSSNGPLEFRNTVVDSMQWEALKSLTLENTHYRSLLLDADALLPEPASIILGYSAIEAITKLIIEICAQQQLPESVAKWTTKEARKESSLRTLFTGALEALTHSAVLSRHDFAKRFERVNKMRNSIVHRGRLELDGHPVSRAELSAAVGDCKALVRDLEAIGGLLSPSAVDLSGYELSISAMLGTWGKGGTHITLRPRGTIIQTDSGEKVQS